MTFEIVPLISIWDLTKELFAAGLIENDAAAEFADELFGDYYMNDSSKMFYIGECYDEVYYGESCWQNPDRIKKFNAIRQYLRDRLPTGTQKILVDISW